jgi:ATP/ADP translocase
MGDAVQMAIQDPHRIAITVLSVVLFGLVLELVRREYLKERYALLWLATATVGLVVGIFPGLIARAADAVHFQLVTTLFVVSFIYVLGIILSFTVIISKLAERNRRLAQDVALLAHRVQRIEENRSGI